MTKRRHSDFQVGACCHIVSGASIMALVPIFFGCDIFDSDIYGCDNLYLCLGHDNRDDDISN